MWEAFKLLRRIDTTTQDTRRLVLDTRRLTLEALATAQLAVSLLQPRLAHIAIKLEDKMPLDVGKTFVATVAGRDQFNNPFAIDFTANPPSWSLSDPTLATMTQDPTAGSEDVTGVAAGNETLSVSCAGLTASLSFVVDVPTPVLTSLVITANPQV